MLAVGQSATLLCKAWCNPTAVAVTDCHHNQTNTTPALAGIEDCDTAALIAVVREETRRGGRFPDSRTSVVSVHPIHHTPFTTQVYASDPPALRSPPGLRPLLIALRI